jgi:large subunit ribosomal protein L35
MPKQKRHSAAKKRFKVTGSGKLLRHRTMGRHLLEKKSAKRKRKLGKLVAVDKADVRETKKLLGR